MVDETKSWTEFRRYLGREKVSGSMGLTVILSEHRMVHKLCVEHRLIRLVEHHYRTFRRYIARSHLWVRHCDRYLGRMHHYFRKVRNSGNDGDPPLLLIWRFILHFLLYHRNVFLDLLIFIDPFLAFGILLFAPISGGDFCEFLLCLLVLPGLANWLFTTMVSVVADNKDWWKMQDAGRVGEILTLTVPMVISGADEFKCN